jgi:hypothetical protein
MCGDYLVSSAAISDGCVMNKGIYRYRGFDITIDVRPFGTPDPCCDFRFTGGYLCHVRLCGMNGHPDLPALSLLDENGFLFTSELDASVKGCLAGEAAVNAALAEETARTMHPAVAVAA